MWGAGPNLAVKYYRTEEEFQYALAEALREEYLAIVGAGFILQIDDPSLTRFYRAGFSLTVAKRSVTA